MVQREVQVSRGVGLGGVKDKASHMNYPEYGVILWL